MPNYITHLAIAKVYAEKHGVTDYVEFLKGSIAPDFRSQEIKHYLNHAADPQDIRKTVTDRVNLSKYLTKIDITKDFGRGVFLHMLADNYCYLNVLDIKKLQKAVNRGADYDASIYNSAMKHFAYIAKKYKIKAEDFESTGLAREMEEDEAKWELEVKQKKLVGVDDIMDVVKLDKFIEEITRQPIETAIAELRSAVQKPEPKPESTELQPVLAPESELELKSEPEPNSVFVPEPEPKRESKPEPEMQNTELHQKILIDESFEHREMQAWQELESKNTDIQSFRTSVMESVSLKPQEAGIQKLENVKNQKKEKLAKDKEEKKTKKIEQKKQKKAKEPDENQSIAEDLVKTLQNSSMFRKLGDK